MFATIGISSRKAPAAGITQVQKKEYFSTADGTNHSIVFDTGPTQNNLLIFFLNSGTTIVTPPTGFTLATSAVDFVAGYIYYKVAGAGESATLSVVMSVADAVVMQCFEYSGMATVSPLDQVVSATAVGSGTTIISGTTAATTQASELIMVSANMRTSEVPAQSVTAWTNSFIIQNECVSTGAADSNQLLNVAAKIVSATGTQQSTGSITTGGSAHDVALVATFKGA